jgi:hypothetical protein
MRINKTILEIAALLYIIRKPNFDQGLKGISSLFASIFMLSEFGVGVKINRKSDKRIKAL